MRLLNIGRDNFIRGESSANDVADGGFSPLSYDLNLIRVRGVLNFAPTRTDRGGVTLTDVPLAATFDRTLSGQDAYYLDSGGAFYTLASDNTFTKRQTITAGTFVIGTSEILQYEAVVGSPFLFATTETKIIRFTGSTLAAAAPDTDFWTGLTTGVRHPMEMVEANIYFGDMNLIHAWDGTTSTSAYVTLPPGVNITSLRKHPDGQHLIAFCGMGQNYSHTRNTLGRIYIVDTVIKDWIREIDIEVQVEGSRLVGGVVYVTYGNNVGYFNGNGISFLKKLVDSATTYSHNMGNLEDILLVRDGRHVRAFGDLGAGKVWWRCASTAASTDGDINCLLYRGDNKLTICYQDTGGSDYIKELDYDGAGVATGIFYANREVFPSEVMIRKIEIDHDKNSGTYALTHNDWEDTVVTLSETITTLATQGITKRNINYKTDNFQWRQGQGPGEIRNIRIYYDPIKQ